MVHGEKNNTLRILIDGKWYVFDEYGRMHCDCVTPDGWKDDEVGCGLNDIRKNTYVIRDTIQLLLIDINSIKK